MSVRSSTAFAEKTDAVLRRQGVVRLMLDAGCNEVTPLFGGLAAGTASLQLSRPKCDTQFLPSM